MDDFLCNDSVYAKLNILFVTGVVRLDPAATGATSVAASAATSSIDKQKFDAWPAECQIQNARDSCQQHWRDQGIPFGAESGDEHDHDDD